MRRVFTCLAVFGLIAAGLPGAAAAEPEAKVANFTARVEPIRTPGRIFPNTGNILGAGAALELEYVLEGSGYGATGQNPKGGIPPISHLSLFLPAGMRLRPLGFPTCTEEALRRFGPPGCPRFSVAGPPGSVLGELTYRNERVSEETSLQAFFGAPGQLLLYEAAQTPAALDVVWPGHFVSSQDPLYGHELISEPPAVATVPGPRWRR